MREAGILRKSAKETVLLLLACAAPVAAQEWTEVSAARQTSGEELLELRLEYAAGELDVGPAPEGFLYDTRLRYDAADFQPVREFRVDEGRARLRLGMRSRHPDDGPAAFRSGRGPWELLSGLRDLEHDVGDEGNLVVGLSREIPTELVMQVGAASSDLELGGLPLRSMTLETGASETALRFESPNPEEMEELVLRAGAAELRAERLGNARFERLRYEGGVGDVRLDFGGDWNRNAEASIRMGLGSLTLRVPPDLGVRVRRNTILASFSSVGFRRGEEGDYRTGNWETAEHRLDIRLEAAFGSIDIEVAP